MGSRRILKKLSIVLKPLSRLSWAYQDNPLQTPILSPSAPPILSLFNLHYKPFRPSQETIVSENYRNPKKIVRLLSASTFLIKASDQRKFNTPLSYASWIQKKGFINKLFKMKKRHWKSDQQSWQHIRGYHELAKITVPLELEGHWCPLPHIQIFAVIEKRDRSSERQSIDILPSTEPEYLEKRTETV